MSHSSDYFFANPKRIFRSLFIGALMVIVTGCATGQKVSTLSPGMSQADVVGVLGVPDGFAAEAGYTVLRYTNELVLDRPSPKADYFVVLKDGEVVKYGTGDVIEQHMGGIVTVLLHRF